MRKLAWFTGGFAGMCLVGCYVPELLFPILAVLAVLIPAALGLRLAARTGRFHAASLAAAARRALALGLGGVAAAGWFLGWSALLRAPADVLAGQERTLSGTVSSYPAETSIGGFSLTVALDGGLTAPDILVYGTQEWGGLVPGDRVTFEARLKASDLMYGDETTYYTAKGIFLTASCGEAPILAERPVQLSPRWWPAHCARALRDSLLAAYDSTAAPLAVALVTGDKSFLSDALDTYLSRSGTSHAMVVSGLHVSCLVAFAVALTRGRRRLALLIVPFLLFYALMAGGTPSAFRAVMMQGVFLAAPIARRETDGLTSLSAALLVLLLLNPYAAGSVSLQLSFTSVAGILAVAPALSAKWLRAVKALAGRGQFWALAARPLRTAALSMATSLGAMAFTQPVLALYFRQTSLIFPLTNLLVLWAVALFLVCALPVGLLGVFLPVLARPLGMLTGLLAHLYCRRGVHPRPLALCCRGHRTIPLSAVPGGSVPLSGRRSAPAEAEAAPHCSFGLRRAAAGRGAGPHPAAGSLLPAHGHGAGCGARLIHRLAVRLAHLSGGLRRGRAGQRRRRGGRLLRLPGTHPPGRVGAHPF